MGQLRCGELLWQVATTVDCPDICQFKSQLAVRNHLPVHEVCCISKTRDISALDGVEESGGKICVGGGVGSRSRKNRWYG